MAITVHICKGKVTSNLHQDIQAERATDGGEGSRPHPGHFTSGKVTWHLSYRWLGGPHSRSGQVWKISPPPEYEPRSSSP